jgi:preprotein translocase subunit SecD
VGPGLIAAGNASRIKHDSVIAGVIAMLLICLLLALTYRRFSSIA